MPHIRALAASAAVVLALLSTSGCATDTGTQAQAWQRVASQAGLGVDFAVASIGALDPDQIEYPIAVDSLMTGQYAIGHAQARIEDDLPQASFIAPEVIPYNFVTWQWDLNGGDRTESTRLALSALIVHEQGIVDLLQDQSVSVPEEDRKALDGLLGQHEDLVRRLRAALNPYLGEGESAADIMRPYRNR